MLAYVVHGGAGDCTDLRHSCLVFTMVKRGNLLTPALIVVSRWDSTWAQELVKSHRILEDPGIMASYPEDWIPHGQYHGLYDSYVEMGMNSESSKPLHNWFKHGFLSPLEDNYCAFTGVTCDDDGYVVGLDLSSTRLSGTLPSFGELPRLVSLKLNDNAIHGTIPTSLFQITSLRNVFLMDNKISGSLPVFPPSTEIRRLMLSRNSLSGTLPSSICNFSNLLALDLSGKVLPSLCRT